MIIEIQDYSFRIRHFFHHYHHLIKYYIYIFFNAQNDSQEGTIRGQSVLFKGDFSRVSMHA
jgi:hypothetical protein